MKIAALVSGGVDSSVALLRLLEAGHEVQAYYLKVWLEDDVFSADCPWEEDLEYASAVTEKLGLPLTIMALQQEYRESILAYTLQQIEEGFTPNPDMLCNNHIKFGAFARLVGTEFEAIATGHYAGTKLLPEGTALVRARDSFKDQTYFLARLGQDQLRRALFPLSDLLKAEVRAMAQRANLPTSTRKDSQGLCFLGKISFSDFLASRLGERPGLFLEEETGQGLGEHRGYWFYTTGQQRGLGLSGGPWYVTRKDRASNTVYISRQYFSADKERSRFYATDVHWLLNAPDPERLASGHLQVKLRHGEMQYHCRVTVQDTELFVELQGQDQGIAPGQFAVFYDEDLCLGSAVISRPVGETH